MMLFDVPYALTAGPSMKDGLMETRSNLYSVLKSQASFSARVCMEIIAAVDDLKSGNKIREGGKFDTGFS